MHVRRFGGCVVLEELGWVLGKLMHVHDMGDRAKLVQIGEHAIAAHVRLQIEQEPDRGARERHNVEDSLDALDQVECIRGDAQGAEIEQRPDHAADTEGDRDANARADQQVGSRDPGQALPVLACDGNTNGLSI